MIQTLGAAVAFVVLAVLVFAASVRLGMLVGVRVDRTVEARAARDADQGIEASEPSPAPASHERSDGPAVDVDRDREV